MKKELKVKLSKLNLKPHDFILVEVGDPKNNWIPSKEDIRDVQITIGELLKGCEVKDVQGLVFTKGSIKFTKRPKKRVRGKVGNLIDV